ncbi:EutN/CcmL family microcompartment protein [candidate division KSB1 bacterium]|nr:EutN/CcmL family microcompartment protein [candidate division KSB1 bacterium]
MELAVVIGNITSTIYHPAYKSCKLMLVENINPDMEQNGNITVAVDSVDAGIGDVVLVAREGKTAGDVLGQKQVPVRSVIVGVVDHLSVTKSR